MQSWMQSFGFDESAGNVTSIDDSAKKRRKIMKRARRGRKKCYLSLQQISRLYKAMLEDSKLGEHANGMRIYRRLVASGLLTDEQGNIMTRGNFGKYHAIAMTIKNSADRYKTLHHCRKYGLSIEITKTITGIPEPIIRATYRTLDNEEYQQKRA